MKKPKRSRITQAEIARRAGISQSSVSKILADPDRAPFEADVRSRVMELARNHHYFKSSKPTHTLGMLIRGDLNDFLLSTYYSRFSQGLIPATEQAGYHVVFGALPENGELPEVVTHGKVDGLLVHACRADDTYREYIQHLCGHVPTVLLNGVLEDAAVTSVMPDNRSGIRQAMQYLRDFGHSHIAYVGGGPDCENQHHDERCRVYRAFLKDHQLPAPDEYVYLTSARNSPEETEVEMEAALRQFRAARVRPTAVVAGADLMALALMQVAQRSGLRIPQDLSLTGYDNTEASRYSTPRLTSVEQALEEMARAAVRELIDRLKRTRVPARRLLFETTLVVRDSATLAPQVRDTQRK